MTQYPPACHPPLLIDQWGRLGTQGAHGDRDPFFPLGYASPSPSHVLTAFPSIFAPSSRSPLSGHAPPARTPRLAPTSLLQDGRSLRSLLHQGTRLRERARNLGRPRPTGSPGWPACCRVGLAGTNPMLESRGLCAQALQASSRARRRGFVSEPQSLSCGQSVWLGWRRV